MYGVLLRGFEGASLTESTLHTTSAWRGMHCRTRAWGMSWLMNPANTIVHCTTYKALCTTILSKELYAPLFFGQLQASIICISHEEAHRLMHESTTQFCRALFSAWKFPVARKLIETHEARFDCRLMIASTSWPTCPAQILVARVLLQPAIVHANHIADDTGEVVRSIEQLEKDIEVSKAQIYSFDVEKLYPSIDRQSHRCMQVYAHRFLHRISDFALGSRCRKRH